MPTPSNAGRAPHRAGRDPAVVAHVPACGQDLGAGARAAGERGSVTAELAMGIPALLVLLFAGLTAIGAVTTKLQCVDAARDAALASARGESGADAGSRAAPAGAEITVTVSGDAVHTTVRAPVPLLGGRLPGMWVDASAVAAVEPGSPGPLP